MSRIMGTTYDSPGTNWHINSTNFRTASSLSSRSERPQPAPPIFSNVGIGEPPRPSPRPPLQSSNAIELGTYPYRPSIGVRDGPNTATHHRGEIVIVHQCTFYRDCFARCLELMYKTHDISSYDAIDRWIEASNGRTSPPDAIVVFLHDNHASEPINLRSLEAAAPSTPVIVLSDSEDAERISQIIRNGARGYIPTSLPFNLAVEAVRFVLAGGTFVPASHFRADRSNPAKGTIHLTHRQTMVLGALCKGMANKQIAYHLGMSEHTVKIHLRHIMRRLNARNRTEAAILARNHLSCRETHDGPI